MLGQPVSMLIPEVVGFKMTGAAEGRHDRDRSGADRHPDAAAQGVVGKFVEFFGPGLDHLSLADRATIANMAPEYGATCGIFPVDAETINYLTFTGREDDRIALVEAYAKAQGMWRDASSPDPVFTDTLNSICRRSSRPAGPKRPQDRVLSVRGGERVQTAWLEMRHRADRPCRSQGEDYDLDGDVVIAAITSCTNTSNPSVMIAAGLVAQKANALGLSRSPG